ncbi:hypothetical protein [Glaciibacter psychrotolerans]|uniref:Uncharacterized protein n=1 Tax=Glaciibacter psychrotolerans TaxID=670054 RepID=A0A7Z0ECI5_9MICO|nr:hypothetical protein [Leifsonia psychrotolerans]NYJ19152.1 hypothetical protein [Leifsonia psychrotolerans]
MDIDWNAIIWFVIWAAAVIASLWLIIWVTVASIAVRRAKAFKADFDKGFDSEFFKRHR